MTTIAIDIDDVISPFGDTFLEYYNKKFHTSLSNDDFLEAGEWKNFYETAMCKIFDTPDSEELYRNRFVEYLSTDAHAQGQKIPESTKQALRRLREQFRLVVITARDESLSERTSAWINSELPDVFEDIYYVGNWRVEQKITKAEVCLQVGAEYLIDDNAEHCNIAQQAGVQGILFGDYGWSQNSVADEGVVRLKDWDEVETFFAKTVDKPKHNLYNKM